mmetsp:Transcript_30194/g.85274  ORF Transcript_30194/g.85274 Transcript_30194/m.85274 type:complete len:258 (+) Transcript_30194:131-904(+)
MDGRKRMQARGRKLRSQLFVRAGHHHRQSMARATCHRFHFHVSEIPHSLRGIDSSRLSAFGADPELAHVAAAPRVELPVGGHRHAVPGAAIEQLDLLLLPRAVRFLQLDKLRHLPDSLLLAARLSELSIVVQAPGVKVPVGGDSHGVVTAGGSRHNLLPLQRRDCLRQHPVHVVPDSQLVLAVVAPGEDVPACRHGKAVVLPGLNLHDLLLLEVADQLRRRLVLVVAHPQLPVEVAPPGIHTPILAEGEHVGVPHRH